MHLGKKKIPSNLLIVKGQLELECVGPQDLYPETESALNLPRVSEIAWLVFRKFACSLWMQIPSVRGMQVAAEHGISHVVSSELCNFCNLKF